MLFNYQYLYRGKKYRGSPVYRCSTRYGIQI